MEKRGAGKEGKRKDEGGGDSRHAGRTGKEGGNPLKRRVVGRWRKRNTLRLPRRKRRKSLTEKKRGPFLRFKKKDRSMRKPWGNHNEST